MKEITEKQAFVAKAILELELQEEETGYYVQIDGTNIFLLFHYNRYAKEMQLLCAYVIDSLGGFSKRELTNYLPAREWCNEFDWTITPVEKDEEEAE